MSNVSDMMKRLEYMINKHGPRLMKEGGGAIHDEVPYSGKKVSLKNPKRKYYRGGVK